MPKEEVRYAIVALQRTCDLHTRSTCYDGGRHNESDVMCQGLISKLYVENRNIQHYQPRCGVEATATLYEAMRMLLVGARRLPAGSDDNVSQSPRTGCSRYVPLSSGSCGDRMSQPGSHGGVSQHADRVHHSRSDDGPTVWRPIQPRDLHGSLCMWLRFIIQQLLMTLKQSIADPYAVLSISWIVVLSNGESDP